MSKARGASSARRAHSTALAKGADRVARGVGVCLATLIAAALALSSGCRGDDTGPEASRSAGSPPFRVSTKNDVQWKRYAAFENDLAVALELDPADLCSEFGRASCIRQVHLGPLGGNDPFDTGILLPTAEPLATTPAVVDRVLLSACGRRVALDREALAGQAALFKELDLNGAAPPADDARVGATITELYRRLLARDPSADELGWVAELASTASGQPVAAADFATLACFAIGGSTEFLFY
jgi:hypothetical protein